MAFPDSNDPEFVIVSYTKVPFKKRFINILDGFRVKLKMGCYLFNGHNLAKVIDVLSKAMRNSLGSIYKFKLFNSCPSTIIAPYRVDS